MNIEMIGIIASTTIGLSSIIVTIILGVKQRKSDKKLKLLEHEITKKNKIFDDKFLQISEFKRLVGISFAQYVEFVKFLRSFEYYDPRYDAFSSFYDNYNRFSTAVFQVVESYYIVRMYLDDDLREYAHSLINAINELKTNYEDDLKGAYQGGYSEEYLDETIKRLNDKIEQFKEKSNEILGQ